MKKYEFDIKFCFASCEIRVDVEIGIVPSEVRIVVAVIPGPRILSVAKNLSLLAQVGLIDPAAQSHSFIVWIHGDPEGNLAL